VIIEREESARCYWRTGFRFWLGVRCAGVSNLFMRLFYWLACGWRGKVRLNPYPCGPNGERVYREYRVDGGVVGDIGQA
jgi:hypothetical protein